jgi:hypothetical protein
MSQMGLCSCTVFSKLLIFLSYIAQRSNVISLFNMLLATGGGVRELMLPLWFALLGGSFVFLDVYFHFVPCIPLFWVLWFIYDWQGFII